MNEFGPEPIDKTEHALWSFAKAANWSLPHPLDYDRFYTFVVLAHERGNWSPDKVRRILSDEVNFEIIENMVFRFEIGISVLECQRKLRGDG